MYKLIILFICAFFIFSCASKKEIVNEEKILVGKIERKDIQTSEFPWFERNYKSYSLPAEFINELKNNINNEISCKVFFGSWCGDSKREVPKFFKLTDSIGFANVEYYGLDRSKKSPSGAESAFNVQRVPTFIFFKNDKEIGRIIENPVKSLHEDFLDIIKPKN